MGKRDVLPRLGSGLSVMLTRWILFGEG